MSLKPARTRPKSSGWAAFDLKQRQEGGFQLEDRNDPYPPMPMSKASVHQFSTSCCSVVENGILNAGRSGSMRSNKLIEDNNPVFARKKLKELHGWADDGLIEDVMATVGNDIDKATDMLKQMFLGSNILEHKGTKEHSFACGDSPWRNDKIDKGRLSEDVTEIAADIADISSTFANAPEDDHIKASDVDACVVQRLSGDTAANMKLILGHLRSVPVEPEWEEDDVYLSHRKDALRMMRLASHCSRAATNAFLRGDHVLAKQHSLKAQEGWLAAERLNSKAAKEILRVRNNNNDPWKLDLHGLHASEAVQALQEHLRKIETEIQLHQPVSINKNSIKNGTLQSPSLQSSSSMFTDNSNMQQTTLRQRPLSLQVITGVGNHSRGQAALPIAVRNFLNDNGYRFDEPRPGVVTVKPKFRHR